MGALLLLLLLLLFLTGTYSGYVEPKVIITARLGRPLVAVVDLLLLLLPSSSRFVLFMISQRFVLFLNLFCAFFAYLDVGLFVCFAAAY